MSNDLNGLPAALETEADVLGSILAEDEAWWRQLFIMGGDNTPEMFHNQDFRLVVTLAAQAIRENDSLSFSSLTDRLIRHPSSQHLTPDPYTFLATLQGGGKLRTLNDLRSAITTLLVERHARKLVLGADKIKRDLMEREITSTEAATELRSLSMESGVEGRPRKFGEIIEAMKKEDTARVMWRAPSGIAALDTYLRGGFEPGRLYIIGARPKVGKTTALLNFVLSALSNDIVVIFASLEIGEAELYAKLLSAQSQVDFAKLTMLQEHKITMDDFPPEEREQIKQADKELSEANLYTMFSPEINNGITSVLNKVMAVQAMHPAGTPIILFVDYIQKLAKEVDQSKRSAEIGDIAWQSKRFSQDYGISVVMPAQLRRAAAEDGGGMPQPHHLKETGSLEQDADVVMLLNRPRLQDPEVPEHVMHINVALNRVGKSTQGDDEWVQAFFDPARQTILDTGEQMERNFEGYEDQANITGARIERRSTRSSDDEDSYRGADSYSEDEEY